MLKILVIDDSLLMRKVARDHLESAGFDVEDCLPESLGDLVDRLKEAAPNLVLSDFNMPHLDGTAVARTVRRTDPKIPVLILTANRDVARDAILQTIGVRRILHKPISGPDLVDVVSQVLAAS